MTVYVLALDNRVVSLNRLTASIGFQALGEEVEMFEPSDAPNLPLQENDIVVGGIGYAQDGMRKLGLNVPVIDSIPSALSSYAERTIWSSTMADLRRRVSAGEVVFAKSISERLKSFDGTLFSSFRDLIATAHLPDDTEIECASPVALRSEHRCYVLHGEPIGLRHYKGDPLVFPEADVIRDALAEYSECPAGCAIDFGVTEQGETLIVEVNDGYAVGAYGLAPVRYAQIIAARWAEIARLSGN